MLILLTELCSTPAVSYQSWYNHKRVTSCTTQIISMDCSLSLPYPWSHLWHHPKFGFSRSMLGKEWPNIFSPKWWYEKSEKNHTQQIFQPQTNQHLHASRFEDLPGSPPSPVLLWQVWGDEKKHPHTISCIQKKIRSTSCTSILKVSKSFRISTKAFHCRFVSAKIWQKPGGPNQEVIHNGFWKRSLLVCRFWLVPTWSSLSSLKNQHIFVGICVSPLSPSISCDLLSGESKYINWCGDVSLGIFAFCVRKPFIFTNFKSTPHLWKKLSTKKALDRQFIQVSMR